MSPHAHANPAINQTSAIPLPLGVRLLVAFLLVDALERIVELALGVAGLRILGPMAGLQGGPLPTFAINVILPSWIVIDVLLAALLLLRMEAGRLWSIAAFALHLIYLAQFLVYHSPHLWMTLEFRGRISLMATLVIDGGAIAYLCARSTREALQD